MKYEPKTLEWFKERIGKTVYRDKFDCDCKICKKIFESGLVIMDEDHAHYLKDCDRDFASEGLFLNYRDNK